MIIDPRQPVPNLGTPQNPFTISVDPKNGNTMISHKNGCRMIFGHSGIVSIGDAHGTYLQTMPDGTLRIKAKKLEFYLDEPIIQFITEEELTDDTNE